MMTDRRLTRPIISYDVGPIVYYEGGFSMQRHAPLAETDGRITSPTP